MNEKGIKIQCSLTYLGNLLGFKKAFSEIFQDSSGFEVTCKDFIRIFSKSDVIKQREQWRSVQYL